MNNEFDTLKKSWLDFEQFKSRNQNIVVEEYKNDVVKTNPSPLISILIITYQHVNYIRNAIESVISQKIDFQYEIIIGDDDSTDGTREICLEYAKKYPDKIRLFLHSRKNNIKVLDRPTGIFQVAYNLLLSRGKYFSIMGGDDYWDDHNKINLQVNLLEQNVNVPFSYHYFIKHYIEDEKKILEKNGERIQTIVGKNIFDKLPIEFTHIMQEDTFFKFFWKSLGIPKCIKSVKPSVVLFHNNSMYTSLSSEESFLQKINFRKKIIEICRSNKEYRKMARLEFFKVIFNEYRAKGVKYLISNFIKFLKDVNSYNDNLTKSNRIFFYYVFLTIFNPQKKNF